MTRCAHALLNNTAQNNISLLQALYEQSAHISKDKPPPRRMFFDRLIPALPSGCMHQAVASRAKIDNFEHKDNCRGQY